jgi:hypothetical protein
MQKWPFIGALSFPAIPSAVLRVGLRDRNYSNEKIFFQSFFMLITVQLFFFASS